MKVLFTTVILATLLSGCAGLGFDKRATLMPDSVGISYETGPVGSCKEWETIKIVSRADWKFAAPVLKEKK